jgi:hypothetical protein
MRAELLKRIEQLSLEIRHYPTPIARCDLHLPALIEERAALMAQLESLDEHAGCSPAALWANDGGPAS